MNNLPISTYYDLDRDDFEGYEEHFIFTNYYFDLEVAIENNQKIKELLNHDISLFAAFSNVFFITYENHLMTIMQLRPLIDTVVFVLIENLKNELDKLKIKERQALLGSLFLKKTLFNYINPAIVVDAINNRFKISLEEIERACERSLLQIIETHNN